MRVPDPPPRVEDLLKQFQEENPTKLINLLTASLGQTIASQPYHPWDEFRSRKPPADFTAKEWWLVVKMARRQVRRVLPLTDKTGKHFSFALPDEVLVSLENISREASGKISISEKIAHSSNKEQYLISSLIEEAIRSSQLEGASTERGVAKEMIRSGREPRDHSEKMIYNNYLAMRHAVKLTDQELTSDMICEIHRIVTEGTLENPDSSGRFQMSGEVRVRVQDDLEGTILHIPPPAQEIPERIQELCDFANDNSGENYVPPALRAITVHFMLSYIHPFEDGNGRTARILFYWSMLKQGYWLTEYLTISKILRDAPIQYARSFLYTEQDDNDLTYFHIYHLRVIERALKELQAYLTRKMNEIREFQDSIQKFRGEFNSRQSAVLRNAVDNPRNQYTAGSHAVSHNVTNETARQDLADLESKGLLIKSKVGRKFFWKPAPDLMKRLQETSG